MLSSGIIDLAIGLAFVFGVTAALASVITELISRFLGLRAAYLLGGLRELLDGDGQEGQAAGTALQDAMANYKAVKGLMQGPPPAAADVTAHAPAAVTATGTATPVPPAATAPASEVPAAPAGEAQAVPTEKAAAPEQEAQAPPTEQAPTAPADEARVPPAQETAGSTKESPVPPGQRKITTSATGALLGSPILRSQGMVGQINSRDVTVQAGWPGRRTITNSSGKRASRSDLRSLPSYISARSVSEAIIDMLVPNEAGQTTMKTIQEGIGKLPSWMGTFKTSLQALANNAGNDIDTFRTSVENWYDDHMDRVSGWYKRHVGWFTIIAGAILVILLNINAITIGRALYSNSVVRTAVSSVAANHTNCKDNEGQQACLANLESELSVVAQAGLPLGWAKVSACAAPNTSCSWWEQRGIISPTGNRAWQLVLLVFGFLLTVVALTPGARFWFDLLGKLGVLRSTGPKPPPPAPSAKPTVVVAPAPPAASAEPAASAASVPPAAG